MKPSDVAETPASNIGQQERGDSPEMSPVSALGKELWGPPLTGAKKVVQGVKLAMRRLPALIALVLLALGVGWVGGMWAGRPSPQEVVSPIRSDVPLRHEGSNVGRKAYLGVRGRTFHQGEVRGVQIVAVLPGSPAAKAGLRSDRDPAPDYLRKSGGVTGYIIVAANGRAIRSEEDLSRLLTLSSPDDVVKLVVTSAEGNVYRVIAVTLGAAPETSAAVEPSAGERGLSSPLQGETPEGRREEAVFRAVNRIREREGLPPLKESPQLQQVARLHSQDMATRHFFGHVSPDDWDVVDRLRAEGIEDFTAVGENIFTGKEVANPAQVAVREWLKSQGHRKNLLNPIYTEAGVGVAWEGKDKVYITQVYLGR